MKDALKRSLTINNCIFALAFILGLIGGIMFLVTATSGYLSGNVYNKAVFWLVLLGVLLICGGIVVNAKWPKIGWFIFIVSALLLAIAFMAALKDRVDFIGDSFIPMERPQEFHSAVTASIVSMVFMVVPILLLAIGCFIPEIRFVKQQAAE